MIVLLVKSQVCSRYLSSLLFGDTNLEACFLYDRSPNIFMLVFAIFHSPVVSHFPVNYVNLQAKVIDL